MTDLRRDRGTARRSLVRRLWPLIVLAIVVAAFFAFDLDRYLSVEAVRAHRADLQAWVSANTGLAVLTYVVIYATAIVAFPPSGAVMTMTGGFLFGTLLAGTYVVFAATVGATCLFAVAKTTLGALLRERAGPFLAKMEAGFQENAFNYLLFLRLVPLFPFWLVNLAPAFLGVSLRTYVIATFIGIVPGTFVYASVGSGLGAVFDAGGTPNLGRIFDADILVPIIGLAVLVLVPVVYKKLRNRGVARARSS